ncbi:MAG: hypothetical protein JWP75_263, partial [Frondihabitans sp.]|nr:hypothetical protein [Frondihabitans sp.]
WTYVRFNTPRNTTEHVTPESLGATPLHLTRRDLGSRRRKARRTRVIAIGCIAAAAVVTGTGFTVSAVTGSPAFGLTAASTGTPGVTSDGHGRVSVHVGSAVTKSTANSEAAMAIATGKQVAAKAHGKTNATQLTTSLASLADYRKLDPDTVMARVATTQDAAASVGAATNAAEQRIAAAKHAAAVKAAAAAAVQAAAAKQAADNTVAGAKATARSLMASQYGWGDAEYTCLVSLWTKESGWSYTAYNSSGATGIPQALPGDKMASIASDWKTNATTQIIWGLKYISGSYGTPCAAWAHSEAVNWY